MQKLRTIAAAAATSLVIVSEGHRAIAQVGSAPVFVGIVRDEGLLVPTAIHDGQSWWNAWPTSNESDESVTTLPVPRSLADIPVDWLPPGIRLPREWSVQLPSGALRRIRLDRPARPRDGLMMATIGIRTNFGKGEAWSDPQLLHEDGVAVSGPATLGRFVPVDEKASRELLSFLQSALTRAETDAIAERLEADWQGRTYTFPATPGERAVHPFQETSWIRTEHPDKAGTFYYFTGSKDYGVKPYPDCDATVDFEAIVIRAGDGALTAPSVRAYTTFTCSRDNAINLVMAPLASLRWAGPLLWVVRHDAEDGYEYSLINPSALGEIQLKGLWYLRSNRD